MDLSTLQSVVIIALLVIAIALWFLIATYVYTFRCLMLVPTGSFITPCTVVMLYRMLYGSIMPFSVDRACVKFIFHKLEGGHYLVGTDYMCSTCTRAYMRLPEPPPKPKEVKETAELPDALPVPA